MPSPEGNRWILLASSSVCNKRGHSGGQRQGRSSNGLISYKRDRLRVADLYRRRTL